MIYVLFRTINNSSSLTLKVVNQIKVIMIKQFLTTVLLLGLLSFTVHAADSAYCTNFALLTTNQYWSSYKSGCTPDDREWNGNYQDQYNWCLETPQWIIENTNEMRTQMFEECYQRADSTSKKLSPNEKESYNIRLIEAILKDDLSSAMAQVKQGADIYFATQDSAIIKKFNLGLVTVKGEKISESLLSYAINQGSAEVGLWILDKLSNNLSKNTKAIHRATLLGNALINASKEKSLTKALKRLNQGANIDFEQDINTGTALFFAIKNRDLAMVKLLLSKKANPDYITKEGYSILTLAINEPNIIKLLLNEGANPNLKIKDIAQHPLNQAILKKQERSIKLLLAHQADTKKANDKVPPAIIQVVRQKDIAILEAFIQAKTDLNIIYNKSATGQCHSSEENYTALDIAISLKATKIIKRLKKAKAVSAKVLCQ